MAKKNSNRFKQSKKTAQIKGNSARAQDKMDVEYNDPAWRMYNELLGRQVSSFPFTEFVGTSLHLFEPSISSIDDVYNFNQPVQVQTVYINPSIGRAPFSSKGNDALNMACLKMYTQFSSSNMKTTQYGPEDIGICMLALGSVIEWSEHLRRAFGLVGTTNPRNWLYPKLIMQSMGIDWDDMQQNIGIYRERFNYTIALLGSVAFPANVDYFKQCSAMYQNVFLDNVGSMAQLYVPVPYSVWKIDETASESGTVLKTVHNFGRSARYDVNRFGCWQLPTERGTLAKMSQLLDILDDLVNALMESSTLQYLYADVLKYVSNSSASLVHIDPILEDYSLTPIYSEEFLINMENAVVCGAPWPYTHNLSTDNDVIAVAADHKLFYDPYLVPNFGTAFGDTTQVVDVTPAFDPIVNFHGNEPDTATRIMGTRFIPTLAHAESVSATNKNFMDEEKTGKVVYFKYYLPDHYIVDIHTWYMFNSSDSLQWTAQTWNSDFDAEFVASLEAFSHPIRTLQGSVQSNGSQGFAITNAKAYCEFDTFTTVPGSTIQRINELGLLSLFQLH